VTETKKREGKAGVCQGKKPGEERTSYGVDSTGGILREEEFNRRTNWQIMAPGVKKRTNKRPKEESRQKRHPGT